MVNKKIAVLGGGPGAHAIAADLALRDFQVTMYDLPEFSESLERTKMHGKIELTGAMRGIATLHSVTDDIEEALRNAGLILVIARSNSDTQFAELCAPHLVDGQIVLLGPGNCGSLAFYKVMKEKGIQRDVTYVESGSLGRGIRFKEPTKSGIPVHVRVFFFSRFAVGVFPAKRTDSVITRLQAYFPQITTMRNVMEAGMNNPNTIIHTAPIILNVGRIERVDNFKLFYEGLTPSVMKVVNDMARERERICTAFGWKSLIGAKEKSEMTGDDWFSTCKPKKGADAIRRTKMPIEELSKDRYIHEDIPYGLVTCSSLGKLVHSATPTIDSIIHLASLITNKNFQAEGRTLEKLGLSGLSVQQINSFLYSGEKG